MTTPTTLEQKARELAELAKKATPGPWDFRQARFPVDGETDCGILAGAAGGGAIAECFGRVKDTVRVNAVANAAFIAACDPQTILALCAALTSIREEALEEAADFCGRWPLETGERLAPRIAALKPPSTEPVR